MSSAAALTWFARHEFRLAWREWLAMVTGGRRGRRRRAIIGLIAFAAIMHLPAYAVVGRFAGLLPPLECLETQKRLSRTSDCRSGIARYSVAAAGHGPLPCCDLFPPRLPCCVS
jgi:hypothetical protein